MFKKITTALLLSSVVFLVGCSKEEPQDINETISKKEVVPTNDYVLTGLDNKEYIVTKQGSDFTLKGAEGKVVIFDIFATWCPPCRGAATHLTSLQKKYKDDLIIIGLTIEDQILNSKLLDFRNQYNANYVLVNSDQNLRLVYTIADELKLGNRFPIPVMTIYKDGKYINHYVGSIEEELVENDIKLALGK
ncbi:MAG: thiol-disulfide isomerase/thioredoxin [Sulfurimonas sp.]|jgi:thiol-disulfide isomerase/thioredoxin